MTGPLLHKTMLKNSTMQTFFFKLHIFLMDQKPQTKLKSTENKSKEQKKQLNEIPL